MRRGERITSIVGAVLVAVAASASIAVLAVHGGRAARVSTSSAGIPSDLAWDVYDACQSTLEAPADGAFSVSFREGVIQLERIESSDDPARVAAFRDAVNDCLDDFRFAGEAFGGYVELAAPAERLLAYGVARTWLSPCISGHARALAEVGSPPPFVDWSALEPRAYQGLTYVGFGQTDLTSIPSLIEMREDCGSGTLPFTASLAPGTAGG